MDTIPEDEGALEASIARGVEDSKNGQVRPYEEFMSEARNRKRLSEDERDLSIVLERRNEPSMEARAFFRQHDRKKK